MEQLKPLKFVYDNKGTPRTADEILKETVIRWTANRKAVLIRALQKELFTREEVTRAHNIGADELDGWIAAYRDNGLNSLRLLAGRRRG